LAAPAGAEVGAGPYRSPARPRPAAAATRRTSGSSRARVPSSGALAESAATARELRAPASSSSNTGAATQYSPGVSSARSTARRVRRISPSSTASASAEVSVVSVHAGSGPSAPRAAAPSSNASIDGPGPVQLVEVDHLVAVQCGQVHRRARGLEEVGEERREDPADALVSRRRGDGVEVVDERTEPVALADPGDRVVAFEGGEQAQRRRFGQARLA